MSTKSITPEKFDRALGYVFTQDVPNNPRYYEIIKLNYVNCSTKPVKSSGLYQTIISIDLAECISDTKIYIGNLLCPSYDTQHNLIWAAITATPLQAPQLNLSTDEIGLEEYAYTYTYLLKLDSYHQNINRYGNPLIKMKEWFIEDKENFIKAILEGSKTYLAALQDHYKKI